MGDGAPQRRRRGGSPKSGKSHSIRLTPQAVEALERHRKMQDEERSRAGSLCQENRLVFPSTVRKPMNPSNLYRREFQPLLSKATLGR